MDVSVTNNIKIYDGLREQLKILRDDLKRYNNKIRVEDDENNINDTFGIFDKHNNRFVRFLIVSNLSNNVSNSSSHSVDLLPL